MGSIPCSSQITCGRGEGEAGSAVTRGKRKGAFLANATDDYCSPDSAERSEGRARTYLPELGTDLVTALAALNVHDLVVRGDGEGRVSACLDEDGDRTA